MRRRAGPKGENGEGEAVAAPPRRSLNELLSDPGPLSTEEQEDLIDFLEMQNKTSSLCFILALSVLHVILGCIFIWLAVRGEALVVVDYAAAATERQNRPLAGEAHFADTASMLLLLQGCCLIAGGFSLAWYNRPSSSSLSSSEVDTDDAAVRKMLRLRRQRLAAQGCRVQLCLAAAALLPSLWTSWSIATAGQGLMHRVRTSTWFEVLSEWLLVWWQPFFHVFVGSAQSMLSNTESDLEGLRSHTYKHEKI